MATTDRAFSESVLGADRIRWGPIIGGVFAALTTLLVLTILGLAIGLAVFAPGEMGSGTVATTAAVWGVASALIAFAIGGWFAAYTSGTTGNANGTINGFMVGATSIVLMLWFVGMGLGNLMGAVAGNLDAVMQVGRDIAGSDPAVGYNEAQTNSWISLAGLVLALGAATIGGFIGHREPNTVYAPAPPRHRVDMDTPALRV